MLRLLRTILPEVVFLVMLGTSSLPARHEVYLKTAGNELVKSMTKNTDSGVARLFFSRAVFEDSIFGVGLIVGNSA